MLRQNISDLVGFVAVAKEQSFTRAAAQLGLSQSGLSHSIRELEARVGVRLLTRTTRSVSPTPAGERLLSVVGHRLDEIEEALTAIAELRDRPAGNVRITAEDTAVITILWPKLKDVLPKYPDVNVEIVIDYGLTDIVAERFDAGVRVGEMVSNGMVAVRIGPEMRMIVVGSPGYFEKRAAPQTPQELTSHTCVNLRLPTHGGLYAWEFEKDGREVRIRVEGQMTFNGIMHVLEAAIDGFGLAYVPEDLAMAYLEDGRLVRALDDWCPPFSGYHLYYPSRRQHSAAFNVILDALRHRD